MSAAPEVLMPYQQRLLAATREHDVVVMEKSRRIGATWAMGADAVLRAGAQREAGGSDVYYLGTTLDLAREFVDTCATWARHFSAGIARASEIEECLFHDAENPDKAIKAFRITFASGFKIMGLSSAPRSLRGRQGYVIIDEAAFHDQLGEVLKAALALLIWGGAVLIISTHNGTDNAFAELCEEIRAGKADYALLQTTFDEAVSEGLYQRVCLSLGREWTADGEREWTAKIRRKYRDNAAEELDCIPSDGGGKYFARMLLEARGVDVPIARLELPDSFVDEPEDVRVTTIDTWIRETLEPLVSALPPELRSFFGMDFARSGDLSCLWPLLIAANLDRRTPFLLELRNVPFTSQWQIVRWLGERLPRFGGAHFDSGVNGAYLAEVARQKWGKEMISEVQINLAWYAAAFPILRAAIEDATFELVKHSEIVDDFRQIELIKGVPRPANREQAESGQRHGDAAVAAALALAASREENAGPIRFRSAGRRVSLGAYDGDHDLNHRLPY